jgi:hypothetical protein
MARRADGTSAVVTVIGADPRALAVLDRPDLTRDRWTSFLSVRVRTEPSGASQPNPPLWGSYRVVAGVIRFEPRFPLEPGLRYQAEFDPVALHALMQALSPGHGLAERKPRFTTKLVVEYAPPAKPAGKLTRITEVHPTSGTLPENLLRFYIHFSAPMSRGEAYHHIRLLDASGKPVDAPFLQLDEELWSKDGRRFTLLF